MNLHHSTGRPDWLTVKAKERNFWQRLAFATNGILTPPNLMTLSGFLLVVLGLFEVANKHYWAGAFALLIGRLADIADGWLAEVTGTKSPFGEALDATVDKVGTFLTILVFYITGAVSSWLLLVLLLPQLTILSIYLLAQYKGRHLYPSQAGKFNMATAWGGLIGLVALEAQADPSTWFSTIVYLLVVISVGIGGYAIAGYARTGITAK